MKQGNKVEKESCVGMVLSFCKEKGKNTQRLTKFYNINIVALILLVIHQSITKMSCIEESLVEFSSWVGKDVFIQLAIF